jgi:beta-lactamase regulating signal transducer with metallopeptidase domain
MTHFLFSSLCLLAFWLFYKLALENISWHNFKRFYLLGVLVISAVIPLLVVKVNYVEIQQQVFTPSRSIVTSPAETYQVIDPVTTVSQPSFDWTPMIWLLYALGFGIMAVRFGRNLWSLRIRASDEVSDLNNYILVKKDDLTVPCSFMNRVYVPKKKVVPAHILDHEKAHLDQKHSWDILFIELLLIVFWFHPLLYLMKYSMKLNHEFLADEAVLKRGYPLQNYQKSLIKFMQRNDQKQLAHTYNFPLIKKRFTIMNKQTKTLQGLLRSLAVIPLLALLIVSCGKEKDEAVLIDHSIDMTANLPERTDHVYGYDFDPYTPKGITEYNGIKYKYEMQDDLTVKLFTMDGLEIDQELNSLHGTARWDSEREIENLLNNADKTREHVADGRLKIITSDLYTKVDGGLALTENVELDLEQLKKMDASSLNVMKFMSGDTLIFYVSKAISFESHNKNNTVYIDNNSSSGTVLINGTAYDYSNDESGIKIFDEEGNSINYYAKGWDIRERLVVPDDEDFDNLKELYTDLKPGSKIFIDDVEVTETEFRKIMHYSADSVRVEEKNGYTYFYLYNLTKPETEYELVSDNDPKDYQVIKTTREEMDRQQKNPVATAMMNAMELKHGDDAVYYLENLEVLPSTITLAASHNLKLGFKVGKDDQGRPSLYAAESLPHTTDDLQDEYAQLLEGVDLNKKALVYYEYPVNITKKQPESGYGISLDSINFKSK